MSLQLHRRAGLTINPLVFLLLLVLIALAVWWGWQVYNLLPSGGTTVYQSGRRVGALMAPGLLALFAIGVAGGVGLTAYFVCGKSDFAANSGIGLVLVLACGFFGWRNYQLATREPAPVAVSPTLAPTALPRAPLRNEAVELMEAQKRAMRQQADALRNGTTAPQPAPTPTDGGGTAATNPRATPPAAPAPSASDLEEARTAERALQPLRDQVRSTIEGFLTEADTAVAALKSSPRALRSEIDKRVALTTALKGKAADLEAYFRGLDDKAEAALKEAGLDFGAQVRQKVAFSRSSGAFEAANAAGVYGRLMDAALEEAQALRDSAGKWRYDTNNQLTSTDRGLQMRLRHLREVVEQRLRSVPEAESALKRAKGADRPTP